VETVFKLARSFLYFLVKSEQKNLSLDYDSHAIERREIRPLINQNDATARAEKYLFSRLSPQRPKATQKKGETERDGVHKSSFFIFCVCVFARWKWQQQQASSNSSECPKADINEN
jgi:hypothetical protein